MTVNLVRLDDRIGSMITPDIDRAIAAEQLKIAVCTQHTDFRFHLPLLFCRKIGTFVDMLKENAGLLYAGVLIAPDIEIRSRRAPVTRVDH